ncbi:MAG: peptidoglycan DD-metalloendopeptidase family protein [Alphaproteobacteria bacterium]|nr:peptidoglycan DD-metalloendopeptidase family protein [Alphaproteobacteria bacterium]MBQ8256114.1 peptidoglycan DD-metalloendopeptidase family protein [Alphaproteobacteria bacterium]
MRRKGIFFTFLLVYIIPNIFDWTVVGAAKSFLTAQKFPTVFEDLSFVDRMEILADDYNDLGAIFDENGVCISGCAYQGITMEEDLERMERQTEAALAQLKKEGYMSEDGSLIPQQNQPAQPVVPMQYVFVQPNMQYSNTAPANMTPPPSATNSATNTAVTSNPPSGQVAASCSTRKSDIPVGQKKPLGEPLEGKARISSRFGPRTNPVTGKFQQNHNGVDLAVPTGTKIYSPADGHVKSAFTDKTCGKGIKVTHSDGYETVYCHLSEHAVKTGDSVVAGCFIGKVGSTGRSTGPHLHYSVRLNGTAINPVKLMGR